MIKNILYVTVIFFMSYSLKAQTTYDVSVANFGFTPSSLTIEVGDTVVWTNIGGTHNVNGTTATFSSNPDSFTSGAAASGWTFFYVFTVAGTYDYQCDPHAGGGMTGTITVNTPNSISSNDFKNSVSIFPNPFSESLVVNLEELTLNNSSNIEFVLYDLLGNQVKHIANINSELTNIKASDLSKGIYIYAFITEAKVLKTGKLTKN